MDAQAIENWTEALRERAGRHRLISPGAEPGGDWLSEVAYSMATFQLGESGGGRHIAAAAQAAGRPDLLEPLRLFVGEEQEHARLLGLVLDLGAIERLSSTWTDGAFVSLRHLGGIRTELLTLLVAEIIGFQFYAAMATAAPTPELRAIFVAIRDDEALHFAFIITVLNSLFFEWSRPRRLTALAAFRFVADSSAIVMAVDHRRALRAAGISQVGFVSRCWDLRRALVVHVSGSPHAELLVSPAAS